jgi:hypothetical protein
VKGVDAGNVGIYGSAIGGAGTTGMTAADWITTNATFIGLGLTLTSLLVGIGFKIYDSRRDRADKERRHKEILQLRVSEEGKTREALVKELRVNKQA